MDQRIGSPGHAVTAPVGGDRSLGPDRHADLWRDRSAWLLGALATVLYGLCAAPGPSWLDSGELVAAARELGTLHPPGHPAWLSLAGLADLLPLGPYAARVAWLSALWAGIAVVLLVRIGRLVLDHEGPPRWRSLWPLLGGAALLASGSLWQVAVRAEVYTLALAANLAALYAALLAGHAARPQVRPPALLGHLALLAVAVCVGLLNHHYVTLFTLPALAVAAWPALAWTARRRPAWLGLLVLGGAWLGLAYLALTLRTLADTEMRWGDPASWRGLWDAVSARHFQRSVTQADVAVFDNLLVLLGMVLDTSGVWLGSLGLGGLALGVLLRDRLQAVLWLALLGALASKALMAIDTGNPDDHGYVLMAPAVLALGVVQLGRVLARLRQAGAADLWARPAVLAVAALAVLVPAGWQASRHMHGSPTNLADLRAPDVIDSHLRTTLAPGTLYLGNYYGLGFNEQAFRIAEGRRPDTMAAHLSLRTGDTDGGLRFLDWFAKRNPEFRPIAVAAARLGRTPVGNLLERVDRQPLFAEQDPALRIPPPFYSFDGIGQRLVGVGEQSLDYDINALRERHARIWDALYARLGPVALRDGPTRAVLLWQHALQAAHALRRGWMGVAEDELLRGRLLNPQDRTLGRLAERLGALDAAWKRADTKVFQGTWQRYATMDFDALTGPAP